MFSALIFKEPPKPSRSGFKSSLNLYHLSEWMPNFCNGMVNFFLGGLDDVGS
jgi:hypothetical protein